MRRTRARGVQEGGAPTLKHPAPSAHLALVCALLGCGERPAPEPPADSDTVSYRRDIQPIWDRYCVRCHRTIFSPRLEGPDSRDHLLQQSSFERCADGRQAPLVVPGRPELSFVYYRISGISAATIDRKLGFGCTVPTPADRRLSETDPLAVEQVRRWIEQGAPAN